MKKAGSWPGFGCLEVLRLGLGLIDYSIFPLVIPNKP